MKSPQALIWTSTQFVGYHNWKSAPDDVAFLRNVHRHVFHVKVIVHAEHFDRHVEFFHLQRQVKEIVSVLFAHKTFTHSCEQLADIIACTLSDTQLSNPMRIHSVEVNEDKENGAILLYSVSNAG